jgi:hypothetical protein
MSFRGALWYHFGEISPLLLTVTHPRDYPRTDEQKLPKKGILS